MHPSDSAALKLAKLSLGAVRSTSAATSYNPTGGASRPLDSP